MVVGMVMVERYLEVKYNKDGFLVVDYYIYVLCGDGDLMEGVVLEVVFYVGY